MDKRNVIIACKPCPGFKIWIRFDDDTEGEVDLAHLANRDVFIAWNDRQIFESVFVDPTLGTLCWPNDIQLDPYELKNKLVNG